MEQDVIFWLEKWLARHADGDWEHRNGIRIESIDNPGWTVTIDLEGTDLESIQFEKIRKEIAEHDWTCRVKDQRFEGSGDPAKLIATLEGFRDWASQQTPDPSSLVKVPTMLRSWVVHVGIARLLRAPPQQFHRKFQNTTARGTHPSRQ